MPQLDTAWPCDRGHHRANRVHRCRHHRRRDQTPISAGFAIHQRAGGRSSLVDLRRCGDRVGPRRGPVVLRLTSVLVPTRSMRVARWLLLVFCGTTCLLGFIPTRHRISLQDASFLHVLAFVVGVACLSAAFWLLGACFADDLRWHRLSHPSQFVAIVASAFPLVPVALGPGLWYQTAGLFQRVFVSALLVWLEVLAVFLVRVERASVSAARTDPSDLVRCSPPTGRNRPRALPAAAAPTQEH